jgi:hypothetical protein
VKAQDADQAHAPCLVCRSTNIPFGAPKSVTYPCGLLGHNLSDMSKNGHSWIVAYRNQICVHVVVMHVLGMQAQMTAMSDGAVIQDYNPHFVRKTDGLPDVMNDMNATFKYSLRSNPFDKSQCDCRLSDEAARFALCIGAHLKAAHASDPLAAGSSMLSEVPMPVYIHTIFVSSELQNTLGAPDTPCELSSQCKSCTLFADQYLKCILHMMSKMRSLLACERGLEWPCMPLYPSQHNMTNMLLNLDYTGYLGKEDRKLLLEVRIHMVCECMLVAPSSE